MDNAASEQEHANKLLRSARQNLRKGYAVIILVVMLLVVHFEYLLFPCILPITSLRSALILVYPVLFAAVILRVVMAPSSKRYSIDSITRRARSPGATDS